MAEASRDKSLADKPAFCGPNPDAQAYWTGCAINRGGPGICPSIPIVDPVTSLACKMSPELRLSPFQG